MPILERDKPGVIKIKDLPVCRVGIPCSSVHKVRVRSFWKVTLPYQWVALSCRI